MIEAGADEAFLPALPQPRTSYSREAQAASHVEAWGILHTAISLNVSLIISSFPGSRGPGLWVLRISRTIS